jgi:alkanesulfonate monooxygenase SsuD/methylene tetrahydromethanopterin reductase-like flavin-dependent oxidoreductase (luciferase family)
VKIGFLVDLRNPQPWARPWPRHYGRTLELIEEAERLGAAGIFMGEHHLTDAGYVPQPLTFAAAVAARTTTVRVGTSVLLAPIRHPMHIAEQAAVVDVLSGGRVELGLGAGYAPREFEAFGVARSERFQRLDRTVAEVRRLLDEVVTPRPVQERVPIWCGYYGIGARRAGRLGEGVMSLVPQALEPYREGLVEGGHDPASARMAGTLDILVHDDPERAAAQFAPHIEEHGGAYTEMINGARAADGLPPMPLGIITSRLMTPDDAVAAIRAQTDGLPAEYGFPWLTVGGMPDDLVERHMTLMLTKVAPALA